LPGQQIRKLEMIIAICTAKTPRQRNERTLART